MILPKTILALIQDFIYLPFLPSSGQCMTEVQGRYRTMTPEKQTEQEKEEAGGGEWRKGGKKREKCQSEFLNILFSMEICTIQLQMFQSKCKWQHRCAQTHTHAHTHCHKAREKDRNDLKSCCSNQDTCSWKQPCKQTFFCYICTFPQFSFHYCYYFIPLTTSER